MLSLEAKEEAALALIAETLPRFASPVVMSSFGKDSMVMLDLVKRAGMKLPILFHREPYAPTKYLFANQVIAAEDYVVHDYPPTSSVMVERDADYAEIVHNYQVGDAFHWMGEVLLPPTSGTPFLCGLTDLYLRPHGTFDFPWDLALIGHKSTDTDQILGDLPLAVDVQDNGERCSYLFPLRHFTNADIWEYTERHRVPYNTFRYDGRNGYREFSDIGGNSDRFHACTACMRRSGPAEVYCPKAEKMLPNISRGIMFRDELPKLPYVAPAPSALPPLPLVN